MPTRAFKPSVTVAAVIEQNGHFLLVQEHTPEGVRFNQPAGHLERGESLVQACVREVREESARIFTPTALLGVYSARILVQLWVRRPQTQPNVYCESVLTASFAALSHVGGVPPNAASRA